MSTSRRRHPSLWSRSPLGTILLALLLLAILGIAGNGVAQQLPMPSDRRRFFNQQLRSIEAAIQQTQGDIPPLQAKVQKLLDRLAEVAVKKDEDSPAEELQLQEVTYRPPIVHEVERDNIQLVLFRGGRAIAIDTRELFSTARGPALDNLHRNAFEGSKSEYLTDFETDDDGFSLRYEVEVIERNRSRGTASFKTRWLLIPRRDEIGELVDRAMDAESNFMGTLNALQADEYVIQCLIYPDSFEAFRTYRERFWQMGFEVDWAFFSPNEYVGLGSGSGPLTAK